MGEASKIEWTDNTFNPWWGCQRVSPGCEHCYAETFDRRVHGRGKEHWGPRADRRFFGEKHWHEPLKWNRKAEKAGVRQRVFCGSMCDWAEKRRDLDPWREQLWGTILLTPWLDWLLLTKRPENIDDMIPWGAKNPPSNVWLGTTVENQEMADKRIPLLLQAPAVVHFLSCEPLLGPVDLELGDLDQATGYYRWIDWVIAGGESGAGARPMHPDWARKLRDQCVDAGVAFFFKQWGDILDGVRIGKKEAGREIDGRTWDEFPTRESEIRTQSLEET